MGERSGFVSKGKELSCEIRRGWWLRGGAAWEQVLLSCLWRGLPYQGMEGYCLIVG